MRLDPRQNRVEFTRFQLDFPSRRHRQIKLSSLKTLRKKTHSSFYYNGVQVGALARYQLGMALLRGGKKAEAEKYFEEIRSSYPEAIDHSGMLLVKLMDRIVNNQSTKKK
jgi:hypothetical protein